MFAIIFIWTPPHFWALAVRYREDYAAAEVPMLPVVTSMRAVAPRILGYTAALWATSIVLAPVAHLGWLYLSVAALLGGVFMVRALQLVRSESSDHAIRLFGY